MKEEKLIRGGDDLAFPGNSDIGKKSDIEKKKLEPVVKGNVKQQKRSFGKRMAELFLGDDTLSVRDYIVHDILIPTIKNTITDVITSSLEMTLFGERRSRSNISRDRNRSYVSYSSYSKPDRERERERPRYERNSHHNFDDIIFESRPEAEEVLSHLADLVADYGVASVADFYDLSGLDSQYTDNKHGWTNLRDAHTDRVRNGYIIRFPRTKPLD